MSNKIPFYVHHNYDAGEVRDILRDKNVPPELIEPLIEQIYGYFHEIGFDIEYDDKGKITKVSFVSKI